MKKVSLILAAVIALSSLSILTGCGGSSEKTAEVTTAVTTKATRITTEAATTDDEEEKNRKAEELRNAVYEIGIEAFNDSAKYSDSYNSASDCIKKGENFLFSRSTIVLNSKPKSKWEYKDGDGDDSRHILNACDEINRALDIPYTVTQDMREKCREKEEIIRSPLMYDSYTYWYDYDEIVIYVNYSYNLNGSGDRFKVEYEFICY
ncbi:MAG: hypothetical protein ACI4JD_07455 [Ruminococcus sp.]